MNKTETAADAAVEVTFKDEIEIDDELICIVYHDNEEESKKHDGESESGVDSSSDDDTDDDESSDEVEGTFPFMDSETDEDELPWERRSNGPEDDDVITIGDEDEEEQLLQRELKTRGHLTCIRCPRDRNEYRDLNLFMLHKARHMGRNHFMCIECKKTFVKYSFCLAHEIRKHGQDFPGIEFPAVLMAREYVKEKEEYKKNAPKLPKTVQWSEEEKAFEEIGGILEVPEEIVEDSDTDEDDPKFHPGHVVASTSLYPYRGPPITKHYEAYQVQLNYGRERRNSVNTISRMALLHRQHLEKNGFLPDQNRASKYHLREHFLNEYEESESGTTSTSKSSISGKKNASPKATNGSKSQRRKKTARRKTGDRKERKVRRTFVSSIIRRTCLLCQFTWTTEAELRQHRNERHPNRKLLDLMTVLSTSKKKKKNQADEDDDLFQEIKIPKDIPIVKHSKAPDPALESFMATLGLISVQKLQELKRPTIGRRLRMSVRNKTKPCSVLVEQLPTYQLPKKGYPVYTCGKCNYFVAVKRYLDTHKIIKHGEYFSQPSTSKAAVNTVSASRSQVCSKADDEENGKRKADSNLKGGSPKKKAKDATENINEEPDWRSSTNPDIVRSMIGASSMSV